MFDALREAVHEGRVHVTADGVIEENKEESF
jgi:hypothetical protein